MRRLHDLLKNEQYSDTLDIVDEIMATIPNTVETAEVLRVYYWRALATELSGQLENALRQFAFIYETAPDSVWGQLARCIWNLWSRLTRLHEVDQRDVGVTGGARADFILVGDGRTRRVEQPHAVTPFLRRTPSGNSKPPAPNVSVEPLNTDSSNAASSGEDHAHAVAVQRLSPLSVTVPATLAQLQPLLLALGM
ncbi:MAG: hypothetical protein U0694_18495 [Anaerolineae bacterium]